MEHLSLVIFSNSTVYSCQLYLLHEVIYIVALFLSLNIKPSAFLEHTIRQRLCSCITSSFRLPYIDYNEFSLANMLLNEAFVFGLSINCKLVPNLMNSTNVNIFEHGGIDKLKFWFCIWSYC